MLPNYARQSETEASSLVRTKAPVTGKIPWPVALSLLWIILAEPLRLLGLQGPTAALFAVLVLCFVPAFLFVGGGRDARGVSGPVVILQGFLVWALGVSVLNGLTREGLQNLSIYGAFASVVLLSSAVAGRFEPHRLLVRLRLFAFLGTAPTLLLGLTTWSAGERFIGTGALPAIAAIGLISCVVMPKSKMRTLFLLFFLAVIFISLSRAYIVFAALALAVPRIRCAGDKLGFRLVARIIVMGTLAFIVMTQYPPLRNRFLVNDGVAIGGIDIGTSGRDALWELMLAEINAGNSVSGAGAGRSEYIISRGFGYITQPHNDYLRLLVDFGLVGLGLWVAGLFFLMIGAGRALRKAKNVDDMRVHVAAMLALAFITASSFLDNVIIYVFLMIPLAVIIGASVARQNKAVAELLTKC